VFPSFQHDLLGLNALLQRTQRRLLNHQLHGEWDAAGLNPDRPSAITTLHVDLDFGTTADELLALTPNVKKLSIKLNTNPDVAESSNSPEFSEELLSAFLGSQSDDVSPGRFLAIESIRFEWTNLAIAGAHLPYLLDLSKLQVLHLYHCACLCSLFQALAARNLTLKTFVHDSARIENDLVDAEVRAGNEFFRSLKMIQRLRLNFNDGYVPERAVPFASMFGFAPTVRLLELADGDCGSDSSSLGANPGRSLQCLDDLLKRCPFLQELALLFTQLDLLEQCVADETVREQLFVSDAPTSINLTRHR
jgi:hypothetical protein